MNTSISVASSLEKGRPWPQRIEGIITHENLDRVRYLVEDTLRSLQKDYFPNLDYETFLRTAVYPSAKWVEFLSFRVSFLGAFSYLITDDVISLAAKYFGAKPKYVNFFGIRFSFPSSTSDGQNKIDNLTYTPMHFDSYDELNTLSFWIPCDDVNSETGGLMWTHDSRAGEFIRSGAVPGSSMYHRGQSVPGEYLTILKDSFEQAHLTKGDAYVFDKTLLHGGAYSKSKSRISADFRLFDPRSPICAPFKARVSDLKGMHKLIKYTAFEELVRLGDQKFIERYPLSKIKYSALKPRNLRGLADTFPLNGIKRAQRALLTWF